MNPSLMAPNIRKASIVVLLLAIVATEKRVYAGFLPSSARQYRIGHPQQNSIFESHRKFGRSNNIQKPNSVINQKEGKQVVVSTAKAIRGGGGGDGDQDKNDDEEEELKDFGGVVSGLFGNLRIPSTLIAGASLASAFALPMLDTDRPKVALAKRLYAFSMMTTLGSMLLVVVMSTISMNDIAIYPTTRHSKSVGGYIDEHYALEWMLVRSHFFYGAFAFIGGSIFRAWISIACPVVGRGVLGILTSLSLVCLSYLIEKSREHGHGQPIPKMIARFLKEIGAKAKTNTLFGAGVVGWVATVTYLVVKVPHLYKYISQLCQTHP